MKLRIERDALIEAVSWTSQAVPARPVSPVLAGIRIVAGADGELSFGAFDFEVSAELNSPAEVADAGSALVNGKLLSDICRSLPDRPVDVFHDGTRITLACGASRFTIPAMSLDEYPQLPTLPATVGSVSASEFGHAVNQVFTAASKDDTLPILTGIRMEIEGDTMTLISTDRYRLAMCELPWRGAADGEQVVALIRAKTLHDIAKSMSGSSTDVTLSMSSDGSARMMGFSASGRAATSLLLDGDYPKVRALFPSNVPTYAVVERQPLLQAVKRVALVAERNAPIRLSFNDDALTLEAGQGDDAQATEILECRLEGVADPIAFNPHFFVDGLSVLDRDYVRLSFTDPAKPAAITGQEDSQGADDLSFRYLLMPVRLTD